jgi:4-aminobutyrate aminotransferase-like enzyme
MDVIKLYPPLILEKAQLDEFSERMETALGRLA